MTLLFYHTTHGMIKPSSCILLLLSLQFIIYPNLSQTDNASPSPTTNQDEETNGDGNEYRGIYLTMIIIFAILFVVVIFCLIYRIYKKRQEENGNGASSKGSDNKKTQNGASNKNLDPESAAAQPEQFKFRGSMSSVENRHERVPSKPVIISVTTPKGTRHVADAFGELKKNEEGQEGQTNNDTKEDKLSEIHENQEEEYGQDNTSKSSEQQESTQIDNGQQTT